MKKIALSRIWQVAAILLLGALLVAACGGDSDDDGPTDTGPTTPTESPCGVAAPSCVDTPEATESGSTATRTQGELAFADVEQSGESLGSESAPVQIDLWMNFICSHCGDFAYNVLPQVVDEYVSTGDAQVTFHNAALGGDGAIVAHEAAFCAADQDMFWTAFDTFYFNFVEDEAVYTQECAASKLGAAGLDGDAIATCLADGTHSADIDADLAEFDTFGQPFLPVFIVNGERIEGPETFADVQPTVDAALSGDGG